jgi:hypothetical protein
MNAGWIVLIVIGGLVLLGVALMFPELRRYFRIRRM